MKNTIKTYAYENGEKQRVQIVQPDSWDSLNFVMPPFSHAAFANLADLYDKYIVRKYSLVFGTVILFYLPEDIEFEYREYDEDHGFIYDKLTALTLIFRNSISVDGNAIRFNDEKAARLYSMLEERRCLRVMKGRLTTLTILPVGRTIGFLSDLPGVALKTNSSFFTMDLPDISTAYDRIGTPIGMYVKDGNVVYPPMHDRDILTVDESGNVSIRQQSDFRIRYMIDRIIFHEHNSMIYARPSCQMTPKGGHDIVVVNNEVIAIKPGGNTPVPSGGYVIKTNYVITSFTDRKVKYGKLNDVAFAVQCGNSVIVNGERQRGFTSPFYDIRKPWMVSFPPSLYPLNFYKDRAPRMIIGADKKNDPLIIWIEGAGKFGYEKYVDSCGASLNESELICERLGVHNAVHLDGGGSAQILYHDKRYLKLSDRSSKDFREMERGVPLAIYVK
ncbi:MAG: phosphodiester glycosidase family protein [Erysipelotrichaceae bacterium]|nr:phosphodiester glycosidase family protein [Erysipelotrichaceae bacterium]